MTRERPHSGDTDEWCDDTRPHLLNPQEWAELVALREIREAWGLDQDDTPEQFSERVYAAKFHFHSGAPGYVGDMYVLQGDALTGHPPLMFLRDSQGRLKPAYPNRLRRLGSVRHDSAGRGEAAHGAE